LRSKIDLDLQKVYQCIISQGIQSVDSNLQKWLGVSQMTHALFNVAIPNSSVNPNFKSIAPSEHLEIFGHLSCKIPRRTTPDRTGKMRAPFTTCIFFSIVTWPLIALEIFGHNGHATNDDEGFVRRR
jgi:hypothetical protein